MQRRRARLRHTYSSSAAHQTIRNTEVLITRRGEETRVHTREVTQRGAGFNERAYVPGCEPALNHERKLKGVEMSVLVEFIDWLLESKLSVPIEALHLEAPVLCHMT